MREDARGRLWLAVVILLLAMVLAACGKAEKNAEYGIGGYVYRAETLAEKIPSGEMEQPKLYNGFLYYWHSGQNSAVRRIQASEGMRLADAETVLETGSRPAGYAVGPDGALYYVTVEWQAVKQDGGGWKNTATGCTLKRRGAGEDNWKVSLPGIIPEASQAGSNCLEADRDGRLFLLAEDGILCIDGDGEVAGTISAEGYRMAGTGNQLQRDDRLLRGEAGRIYYVSFGVAAGVRAIYEIAGKEEFRLEKIPDTGDGTGVLYGSEYGLLCSGRGVLYQYRGEDSGWVQVLRWTDGGISVANSQTDSVMQTDEGHFLALVEDAAGGFSGSLYRMTRLAASELPEKETLVLAAVLPSRMLEYHVANFNRVNDRYAVVIEEYAMDEVATRLNARLASQNPPDLVDVSYLDVLSYAEKQMFEDLAPYIEESGVLDMDDFFKGIREGYTIGGRLVCIPGRFRLWNAMVRTSQAGDGTGWTMEDIMAMAEAHPDMRLLNYGRSYVSYYFLPKLCKEYICRQYIDWETGECSFDGENFRRFMEWLKSYFDRFHAAYGEDYVFSDEETLIFLEGCQIDNITSYAWHESRVIGEESTVKGMPTPDGSPCIPAVPSDILCILARSARKEGAWEFVEYFLSQEEWETSYGFPGRRDIFLRQLEEEMTPEYVKDEDGNVMVYEGKPVLQTKLFGVYDYMPREQADRLLALFDAVDFAPRGGIYDKVIQVVREELDTYMDGTREAGDVAKNIQNRVKNLVEERMTGR